MGSSVRHSVALLVDVQDFFRVSLSCALMSAGLFDRVVEVRSFSEAVEELEANQSIGFVAADLPVDGKSSAGHFKSIRTEFPDVRLAAVAWPVSRGHILACLQAGVHGYIPKTFQMQEILDSISQILAGQMLVPPTLADSHALHAAEATFWAPEGVLTYAAFNAKRPLSVRETEVLDLIAQGKSNKEIAKRLKLAEGTVKVHVNSAYRALGAHNRVGAVLAMSRLRVKQPSVN